MEPEARVVYSKNGQELMTNTAELPEVSKCPCMGIRKIVVLETGWEGNSNSFNWKCLPNS